MKVRIFYKLYSGTLQETADCIDLIGKTYAEIREKTTKELAKRGGIYIFYQNIKE